MAISPEWYAGRKVLTAEQVKALPVGAPVEVISADRHGEKQTLACAVAQYGKQKRLSFRDWRGERCVIPIRDYPNKVFAEVKK